MGFECLDGTFCSVAAVDVGRHELDWDVFVLKMVLDVLINLIFKQMDGWGEALWYEDGGECICHGDPGFSGARGHGDGNDGIGIF